MVAEKVVVMRPKTALVFEAWMKDAAEATTAAEAVAVMCLVAMANRRAAACWDGLAGPARAMKFHGHPVGPLVNEKRMEDDHTDHPVIQHVLADL